MDFMDADADWLAMDRLASGEDLALNEIMTRWQQPLANFLFRRLGHERDAIELAQETFVKVYEAREKVTASGKFSTWLFSIAVNQVRNHLRWKTRHPTVTLDDEDEGQPHSDIPSSTLPPDEQLSAKEKGEIIRRSIHSLPEELMEVFLFFEYENLSYDEIAVILHCTRKAVETRLYRARNILREKLASFRIP